MFNKLLFITTLVVSIQSFAGQDGNGGYGVNCNGQIEVLDLYEAKELYRYNVDLGPANASVDSKVEIMLSRLDRINRTLAIKYREQYKNLWNFAMVLKGKSVVNNTAVIVGNDLAYKVDVGETILPEDCKLTPLARNMYSEDLEYHIYFFATHWDKLSNDDKAVLILHEMIYYDKTQYLNHVKLNSSFVRKIISLLVSTDSMTMPMDRLIKKLSPHINVELFGNQVSFVIETPIKVSPDGNAIVEATLNHVSGGSKGTLERGLNKFHNNGIPFRYEYPSNSLAIGGHTYSSRYKPTVVTYENGSIKIMSSGARFQGLERIFAQPEFKGFFKEIEKIRFNREGKIECIELTKPFASEQLGKVKINGKWQQINNKLQLDANEKPISLNCEIEN